MGECSLRGTSTGMLALVALTLSLVRVIATDGYPTCQQYPDSALCYFGPDWNITIKNFVPNDDGKGNFPDTRTQWGGWYNDGVDQLNLYFRVVNCDGKPIEGAEVKLYDCIYNHEDPGMPFLKYTDNNGWANFTKAPEVVKYCDNTARNFCSWTATKKGVKYVPEKETLYSYVPGLPYNRRTTPHHHVECACNMKHGTCPRAYDYNDGDGPWPIVFRPAACKKGCAGLCGRYNGYGIDQKVLGYGVNQKSGCDCSLACKLLCTCCTDMDDKCPTPYFIKTWEELRGYFDAINNGTLDNSNDWPKAGIPIPQGNTTGCDPPSWWT